MNHFAYFHEKQSSDPVVAAGKAGKLRRSSSVAAVAGGATGGSKNNRKESRGLDEVPITSKACDSISELTYTIFRLALVKVTTLPQPVELIESILLY